MGAYQAELQALRQRTPIGLRHGLALLQQTKGDVATAEALFQQELTQVVAHQAQVSEAAARHALEQAGYEVPRALQQLEQQQYSLTQRILRRYRDPADAVRWVADAVEQTHQVPRSYWLDLAAAQRLLPPLACVLVVNEWLALEDWEGLAAAVHFQLEVVLAYCDQLLRLPQVSDALRHVAALEQAQAAVRGHQLIYMGFFSPGPEVAAASAAFDVLRPRLVQRLYKLIEEHIALFP